jgi:hypothetical protein
VLFKAYNIIMSEIGITQEINPEEHTEPRASRVISLLGRFFERNKITTIIGSGYAGSFIGYPPQTPTEVAERLAIAAGILAGTNFLDRKQAQWDRKSAEREAKNNAR